LSSLPFSHTQNGQANNSKPTDDILEVLVDWNGDVITCRATGKSLVRTHDGHAAREIIAKAIMRLTEWEEKPKARITIQIVDFEELREAKPP
jgi:hypothetical protein